MDSTDGPGTARNPYEVLGVSPDASQEEIRDSSCRLVRFPRMEGETEWTATHLAELQDAYEVLSDPFRRAELDAGNGISPAPPPEWPPPYPQALPPAGGPAAVHHS